MTPIHLLQTSYKSTLLPIGFLRTAQTSHSQTPAQPLSKVKIKNVPDSTLDHTNSNFLLTMGGTVFYQPESEYEFPDPQVGGFNYCNFNENHHVDRKKPPYPPITEQNLYLSKNLR